MRKLGRKILSIVTVLSLIASIGNFSSVGADELTIEQMIGTTGYNLALGRQITSNPSLGEGNETALSDGKLTPGAAHAATTFDTANTYYLVDLGKVYDASTIDTLAVGYKEKNDGDNPVKGYQVQYSANGLDFTTVKTIKSTDVTSQITTENLLEVEDLSGIEGKVRFIKILYKDAYAWGIQATEVAVISSDANAREVEADKCADAASVTVDVVDFNTISYNIEASENQEGFKYLVYLMRGSNSKLIGNGVDAGKDYVVEGINAAMYTLKVVSCFDGAASDGINSGSFVIQDVSEVFSSRKNITNRSLGYKPTVLEAKFYEGHNVTTALKALDGKTNTGEGPESCLRVIAGGNQSVVVDLGEYYTPSEMSYMLFAFTNKATAPSDVKIEFSQNGDQYKVVGEKKGYVFAAENNNCGINRVNLDQIDNYTSTAVRFVKMTFSAGTSTWGYCINEISLIANTDQPTIVGSNIKDPADVIVSQEQLESLSYEIVPAEGQDDATYVVSVDGTVVDREAKAGIQYDMDYAEAGIHEVTVATIEEDWLSKGITAEYEVLGYTSYINTALNIAHSKYHNAVATTDSDNIRTDDWKPIGQDISGGVAKVNNGITADGGHHTGYLQTRPDSKSATVDLDLGEDYLPEDIHSVVSVFNDAYTAATDYEISFSADGETFETLCVVTNAKYKEIMEDVIDMSKYKQEKIRYVRYHMSNGPFDLYHRQDGTTNWEAIGYLVKEIAVMHSDNIIPEKVREITVSSSGDNLLDLSFKKLDNPDYSYVVYLDGHNVGTIAPDADSTLQYKVSGGLHRVRVAAFYNGYESLTKEYKVTVNEAPTTARPTTTAGPTTAKPTKVVPTSSKVQPVTSSNVPSVKPNPVKAPGKAAVKKVTKKKSAKKMTVTLKKVNGAVGYKVSVFKTAKNAKKKKGALVTKTTKSLKVTISSKKIKKLKVLYVRARAYVMHPEGFEVYGAWSAVKKVKAKK